jgi:hypothetical protein
MPLLLALVELGKGLMPLFPWDLYRRLTGVSTCMVSFRGRAALPASAESKSSRLGAAGASGRLETFVCGRAMLTV